MSGLGVAVLAVRMFVRPATRRRGGIDTPIKAVIQGVRPTDLSQLSMGERATEYRSIWSEADLRTTNDDTGETADIVIDEFGSQWRLIQDGFRVEAGFTNCIGEKVDDRGRGI